MDLESKYEISRVASLILKENFSRVALQFPDELLKDSTLVVKFLREKLVSCNEGDKDVKDVRLYVMADTTYGSCCVDEVGASHINADCVIHFGHTCLSQTSNLPALFVFGKEPISASNCAQQLCSYALMTDKPILVLYGLEYAYALQEIKEAYMVESMTVCGSSSKLDLQYADIMDTVIFPSNTSEISKVHTELVGSCAANEDNANTAGRRYRIGGLHWSVMEGRSIEDYVLFWVGTDNSAFANVVLTFNGCEIVRYDAKENLLETDFSQQRRILKRRYYLVEKAKDATIVGILVGTLGIAGYLSMIHQIKEIITKAGKKAYTLVMGRPNPAKLANFPECDVFVYISCAQTALLDSKEFLAPVITPFEAMLAFGRGSQWTGRYVMEFQGLITSPHPEVDIEIKEARFSFLQGGYVEDVDLEETSGEDKDEALALVNVTEKALLVRDGDPQTLVNTAKSGAEFFASRSFQGLDINSSSLPGPFVVGRSGKASGYDNEKSMH